MSNKKGVILHRALLVGFLGALFLTTIGFCQDVGAIDKLSLKLVYTGTKQKDKNTSGTWKYGTAQSITVTDRHIIVFTRPNGGVKYSNSRAKGEDHNEMYVIDRLTLRDVSKTYSPTWDSGNTGATGYLMAGHANAATWDSKNNRIIVGDANEFVAIDLKTSPFKNKGRMSGVLSTAGVAYNADSNKFYERQGSSLYLAASDLKSRTSVAKLSGSHPNQDIGYHNGYIYGVNWISASNSSTGSEYTDVYQYNAQGTKINQFRIGNGEFEGIDFAGGEAYVLKSTCTGTCKQFYVYQVNHDAVWKKLMRIYTITYNANGGSGAPTKQNATINYATTISSTVPTRAGYTFQGWAETADATTVKVKAGGKYTGKKDVTLYAIWKEKTYKITFNVNGGTNAPAAQTQNVTKTIKITSSVPTRSGYKFLGWAKSKTATTANYQPGDTYSGAASITLYAVWQLVEFRVSYNANGGTGAPAGETANAATKYTISSTKPTRTGYDFVGWAQSASATSASYMSGKAYQFTKATTLYAVWSEKNYTITYNANGGTGAPAVQTNKYSVGTKISSTKPTRAYYTFKGWSTNKNATTAQYTGNDTYTGGVSITLYAIWEENTRTITYDANGGTGAPAAQSAKVNTAITISSTEPVWDNHIFLGWATDADATAASYQAGDSYTSKASATLYALWREELVPIVAYMISYNANGGAGAPENQTVEAGQQLTISSTRPTRDNYNFLGWSLSNTATKADYAPEKSYTIKSDLTLYAVWSVNTFTVSYDANGGEAAPAEQTSSVLERITITNDEPLRDGYIFKGWAKTANATNAAYHGGDQYDGNADVTLYAVWEEHTYTVAYSANGGTGAPSAETIRYGVMTVISSVEPTRNGYTFIGWGSTSDSESPIYFAGDSYTFNQDVTIYAIWASNTYTVTFDPNGGEAEPVAQVGKVDNVIVITTETPIRDGYNFIGWSTDSNAIEPSVLSGDEFTSDSDVVLYAVWAKDGYLVSFNAMGSEDNIEAQASRNGESVVIPEEEPTREGFTFLGWASLEDADVEYHPGDTYDEGVSKELFAVWANNRDIVEDHRYDHDDDDTNNPKTADSVMGISGGIAGFIAILTLGGASLKIFKRR
ncbi:InlB B-repeat-containing protein [Candidatus Saccharibacteria bacterium]|nr:InlB B-repeat-containing protein [Candidatus Saccharibacteria bacterium]